MQMSAKKTNTPLPWVAPDDDPELTDADISGGKWMVGDKEVSTQEAQAEIKKRLRGRPAGSGAKSSTTLRLDTEVLEAFRATGRGWQTRVNNALQEWLREHGAR
jgi:uncharacterized protein (DUF4415 family)